MSPEQARGQEIDHRSDIFSLGTILYEMLAGEPPFKGEHEAALLYVIVHEEQNQLPDTLLDEYPDLKYVSARMLEKDPAKRYQSMDELRADLIGLMGDTKQISSATRSSLRRSEWRSKRRFGYIGLAVLAVVVLFAAYFLMQRDKHVTNLRSIAVLPFDDIVTEPGYEWFGYAQREAITGHLTKIDNLKVISNVSSNRFRDSDLTPSEIAGELGVATLLKASVQQSGGRLLLMIKLIEAGTNDVIWAEDYNRDLGDVFDVQAEVALSVADQLRARLAENVEDRINARPTENLEAYKLVLQSLAEWASGDVDRRAESLELLRQAIEIDPEYSQAYGRLAMAYFGLPFYGYKTPRETTSLARKNALKALELDEGNQLANNALILIKMMYDWDWKGAEESAKKYIDLYPGASLAYENYAWILMLTGRIQEMVDMQSISRELDPLSESKMQNDGERLYYARRYDEAIKASLDAIELNPNHAESRVYLGLSYIKKGLNVEALEVLEEELELFGYGRPEIDQMIGTAFAMAGAHARAREVLDFLLETSRDRWVPPSRIANIYFALGEDDLGFEWLERAFAEHDPTLPFIKVDPVYDRLISDPRYIAMLEKLGLAG
jgi:serine/threonine-protein kinase